MKKILLFIAFLFLLSCSSDDNSSSDGNSQNLKFNNINYSFDKVYVVKGQDYYLVWITQGSMSFDFSNPQTQYTYSPDFKRMMVFIFNSSSSSLSSGTHGFEIIPANEYSFDNAIDFLDDCQIENGQLTSYDTVFSHNDNTSTQSRVVITKFDNDRYSFDFNVITTAGILTGTYAGTIIKANY